MYVTTTPPAPFCTYDIQDKLHVIPVSKLSVEDYEVAPKILEELESTELSGISVIVDKKGDFLYFLTFCHVFVDLISLLISNGN